jgi:Mn2+/Fe2+ NRAMP family transporter
VARIYQARFIVGIRSAFTFSFYLFLDRAGKTPFKLPGKWWPEDRIEALGSAAGIPVNGTRTVLDGPAFRRAFPGSISCNGLAAPPLILLMILLGNNRRLVKTDRSGWLSNGLVGLACLLMTLLPIVYLISR